MAGGTSRLSFAIEISIINHPAFGVSPFMETPFQVQIIAQEPAEVESCKVFQCCSALFQEAYGSSPSFFHIHPILRFQWVHPRSHHGFSIVFQQ